MGAEPRASPPEARSGLDPWEPAELPAPPVPRGLAWFGAVGPGVIVLGLSIGSGEFLLGPAVFVRYGLSLLWVTAAAVLLQTIFNLEVMRYTLATGEPVFTGFMRTRPSGALWAAVYAGLYFVQSGWPAWAANAAGAIFFLFTKQLAGPTDASAVYWIGVASFLACVGVLLVGRRIVRTLELLNWVLVGCIIGGFFVLAVLLVPPRTWVAAVAGLVGFDTGLNRFVLVPPGADFVLLAALAGYAGAGGCANIVLANWARDKGYGMSRHAGYIPAAIGGAKVHLAHRGFRFVPDSQSMIRWRGWWRIVRADQWGVFCTGALLGMVLPALLYVTFVASGSDIRGLGIGAALANGVGRSGGPLLAGAIAFLGAWILFKTQLDSLEGMVRGITDIVWTGSRRAREWARHDVRRVYYTVLAVAVLWGISALRLAQPIVLLQLGANVASAVLALASLHLLYINTRLLPRELRPSAWRRAVLVGMAVFYGYFVALSVRSLAG